MTAPVSRGSHRDRSAQSTSRQLQGAGGPDPDDTPTFTIPETVLRRKRTIAVRDWLCSEASKPLRDVDYAVAVLERDEEGARGDAAGLVALAALTIALATFTADYVFAAIGFYFALMIVLVGLLIGYLDGFGRESVLRSLYGRRRDLLAADVEAAETRVASLRIARAWGIFRI